jgi:glycosyltransferase involved in cell wall biosynthesis
MRQRFDVLWIEKEALPWWPLWAEEALLHGVPYVLDYDDAVFHNYDRHRLAAVRRLFGRRLDGLMRRATLVVGGNDYLAQRAGDAGAGWVEVLPTVIDLARYPWPHPAQVIGGAVPTVVWIGSPSTSRYLHLLEAPLRRLAQRVHFVLRVIGGEVAVPGVQVECLPWSEDTEVAHIATADVGVMPLVDTPWERGKCGYKLIQYMACGLPVVASPVGVNSSLVREGVDGFLANDHATWVNRMEQLLTDANLRMTLGAAGRQRVEHHYCLQVTGPRLSDWLHKAAQQGR